MESMKNIRLSVGFMIVVGAPPYLVYDFQKMTQEGATLFDYFMFALAACLVAACAAWLVTLRGREYVAFKSLWERPLAFLLFIVSLPLLLIFGFLIKIESPGPAVYRQQRSGKNRRRKERRRTRNEEDCDSLTERRNGDRRQHDLGGRPFTIYKLRSMKVNAEKETGAVWSTGDGDSRVTKVGHYIRKTHMDELPQLLNVVFGEMSIIGPRPERAPFIAQLGNIIEGYKERLTVPPGITGLAQVRQEHDKSVDDVRRKLDHDREYIQNASLFLDIRIMLETAGLIVSLIQSSLNGRKTKTVKPKNPERLFHESAGLNMDN